MYSYTYDPETGGVLLNMEPAKISKEPSPVYANEMNLLGFHEHWDYADQDDSPYMWKEGGTYYYRGVPIIKAQRTGIYTAPVMLPCLDSAGNVPFGKESGARLCPVDIATMCRRNAMLLDTLETSTIKLIVDEYEKMRNKLDLFYVAFSGGKDSCVLLSLVKKALPKSAYCVIFGDTGMETPDTYACTEQIKRECKQEGVSFIETRSRFTPEESWGLFAPPSRTRRWCCSVHKSTPQTLKAREVAGRPNYQGLSFVGVRGYESARRNEYEYENEGGKVKGQYEFCPILRWTAAEVWLYVYSRQLTVNAAYKKGITRVGCLLCPMGGGANEYFSTTAYNESTAKYINRIKSSLNTDDPAKAEAYIQTGGWSARTNGMLVRDNPSKYHVKEEPDRLIFEINPQTDDWREWVKTLGAVTSDCGYYTVTYKGHQIGFSVDSLPNGYRIAINTTQLGYCANFLRLFKRFLKKSAYCVGCQVCEANCREGRLRFDADGHAEITDCIHCHQCYEVDDGCLVYDSLKHPLKLGGRKASLNVLRGRGPHVEWLEQFFAPEGDFFGDNTLEPADEDAFKRFVTDAGLYSKGTTTSLLGLIRKIGWDTPSALWIMLVNLTYANVQIEWYVKAIHPGRLYTTTDIAQLLSKDGAKASIADSIVSVYRAIMETPFGTKLLFGRAGEDGITRTKCDIKDARSILYVLYKFAEACGSRDSFALPEILGNAVGGDVATPGQILGSDSVEEWTARLGDAASRYPEFIRVAGTGNSCVVSLSDKTSSDALDLFATKTPTDKEAI